MARVTVKPAPALPKPAVSIPKIPKTPAPKAQKAGALAPLFGQKRSKPTIMSVPTRTPSF